MRVALHSILVPGVIGHDPDLFAPRLPLQFLSVSRAALGQNAALPRLVFKRLMTVRKPPVWCPQREDVRPSAEARDDL
jgi:hypothetical protein